MALNASTTLPHSAGAVLDVLTRRDFVEHVSQRAGATLTEFTVSGPSDGAFTTTTVRSMPTDRFPDMVKKFVGQTLNVTQHESWSAPAADGSRSAEISVDIAGAPVKVKALQKLVAAAGSTTIELTGDVTSSIPFLGGKIASTAEPYLAKALNLQAAEAKKWLDQTA
ncbi:MAG TPA: DUF2505 domain-containing protein [Arthrobacter sp.]|nr:DUF2505 domain-containing protein [Arthrobacter sp.]